MNYKLKIIINGVEVLEEQKIEKVDGAEYSAPSILDVRLQNNATLKTMEIGATACDCLTFTMLNPFSQSFDGQKVEFLVKPITTVVESLKEKIEAAVGTETTTNAINEAENNTNVIPEEEEGEPLTEEELEDVEATAEANVEDTFNQLEGEADATTPEAVTDSEWHRIGVYYVQNQETLEDNKIRLTCYDGFAQLNGIWMPMNREGTTAALFEDLRSQIFNTTGIFVEPFEFGEEPLKWNTMSSYRTALGYFAGLAGGFVGFDEDGDVAINFYGFTDNILIKEELLAYTEDSAGEMLLTEISCNTSLDGINESILESGAGQGISFNNPYMTQESLDAILADYTGVRFTGGNIKTVWNESLIAGEFIKVFTAEEYDNYLRLKNAYNAGETDLKESINSLGTVMLISSQVITFGGDAVSNITSVCSSEAAKENVQTSPTDQKFRNIYANSLTVEALEAGTAKIKDAYIESINGSKINNSAIFARALSHEMVSTLLGVNVYYQADEPTPEKVGDIWYRTVADADFDPNTDIIKQWDGSAWVTMPEAAGIFAANSVTAQEIAANTITANNMNMENLQTNLSRVGDPNGQHITIEPESVTIHGTNTDAVATSNSWSLRNGNKAHFIVSRSDFDTGTDSWDIAGIEDIINDNYGKLTVPYNSADYIEIHYRSGAVLRWEGDASRYFFDTETGEQTRMSATFHNMPGGFLDEYDYFTIYYSHDLDGIERYAHPFRIVSQGTLTEQTKMKLSTESKPRSDKNAIELSLKNEFNEDYENVFQVDWDGAVKANSLNVNGRELSYIGEFATIHGTSASNFTLSTTEVNTLKGHCTFGSLDSGRCSTNYADVFDLNVSTGVVTVKKSGTYTIHGHWYFTTGFSVNDLVHGRIRINNSAALGWDRVVQRVTNAAAYINTGVSMTVHLNAGDTIENVAMNQTAARGIYYPNGSISLIIVKVG